MAIGLSISKFISTSWSTVLTWAIGWPYPGRQIHVRRRHTQLLRAFRVFTGRSHEVRVVVKMGLGLTTSPSAPPGAELPARAMPPWRTLCLTFLAYYRFPPPWVPAAPLPPSTTVEYGGYCHYGT